MSYSWQICGWFSRDSARFTLETIAVIGVQHLDGDRSAESRVDGSMHLAHAAGADQGDQFIRSETCAGSECQE